MPKISVVMPVYNGGKYLKEAIQSILCQTESDFELIIVDDGSQDESLSVVRGFSDPRIKLFLKNHSGLIDTLNLGLEKSQGKYLARMDADDISLPCRFRRQVEFLDRNDLVAMCGTWAEVINSDGKSVGEYIYPPVSSQDIRKYIWIHNPFIHPTVMIRRTVLHKVGGYRNFWKNTGDDELWTRIVFLYPSANIPEKLLKYRIHGSQLTTAKKWDMRLRGALLRISVLGRYLKS